MFKNSIFTNPIGWADKMVGTKTSYITNVIFTIFIGVLFTIMAVSLSGNWQILFIILLLVYIIEIPLFCFRAIRKLILKRKLNTGRTQ